jgi:hypothetical protein
MKHGPFDKKIIATSKFGLFKDDTDFTEKQIISYP